MPPSFAAKLSVRKDCYLHAQTPCASFGIMQITLSAAIALFSAAGQALAVPAPTLSADEILQQLNSQSLIALNSTSSAIASRGCSLANAYARRDWNNLSSCQRTAYIDAVQCLMSKPSKADPTFAPGAKTRYDDFVAVHINQTLSIHGTGNFLTWHRYFTWAYETALRDECGYKGAQPYWNWFDGKDFASSPLFDGSPTSMSGDGSFVQHNGSLSGTNNIFLPSGNGGGCLKDGPFVNMTANLGPVSPGMDGLAASATGPLGPNPRCLRRDLTKYSIDTWMTASNLLNVTVGAASVSVETFQNELQGRFGDQFLGMHAAGHFVMGGDSSDLFSSPSDPIFFLHHAMVDRLYWVWQALHLDIAKNIAGTITILNTPPSRDALLTDVINLGVNAPETTIGDSLSTLGGTPFCYYYL
ncbi:Di-copper centre-containing protein [Thozetella sp. PMI_491]|nr:Di-copper centre-containing protein [Thozetella sp. PMI_491]